MATKTRRRVIYVMHDSPLGPLGLAATESGLASLMLRVDEASYVHSLGNNCDLDMIAAQPIGRGGVSALHLTSDLSGSGPAALRILDRTRLFLDRYFAGRRIAFEGPFDLLGGTPFQRRVWATLLTIPYGEVRSYRWLAGTVGHPGAFRAVGMANGQNPIPVLIPCHRVINHNGGLGGYSGGLDLKRRLLALEQVPLAALTRQTNLPFTGVAS